MRSVKVGFMKTLSICAMILALLHVNTANASISREMIAPTSLFEALDVKAVRTAFRNGGSALKALKTAIHQSLSLGQPVPSWLVSEIRRLADSKKLSASALEVARSLLIRLQTPNCQGALEDASAEDSEFQISARGGSYFETSRASAARANVYYMGHTAREEQSATGHFMESNSGDPRSGI
jgi:hypothetical protein